MFGEGGLAGGYDDFRPPGRKSYGTLCDPVDDMPRVGRSATGEIGVDGIGCPWQI
jgi:hypothetical protein